MIMLVAFVAFVIMLVACHDLGVDHVMTQKLQGLLSDLDQAQRLLVEAELAAAGQLELAAAVAGVVVGGWQSPEGQEYSRMAKVRDRRLVERDDALRQVLDQARDEGAIS